jgi:hypothetical protein
MAATATFNSVAIGDAVTNVSSGNISRDVVIDPVLDIDGVVTRNRGGGVQWIRVEAYRECDGFIVRLGYVEGLYQALGNEKATLTVHCDGSQKTWTGCLLTEIKELESAGAYVKFQCAFVR